MSLLRSRYHCLRSVMGMSCLRAMYSLASRQLPAFPETAMWPVSRNTRRLLARQLLILMLACVTVFSCTDMGAVLEPALQIRSHPSRHNEVLTDGAQIQLSFDRTMDPTSVDESFRIRESGSAVAGVLHTHNAHGQSYIFEPAEDWEPRRRYELILSGHVRDVGGGLHRVDHRRAFSFGGGAEGPLRLLESFPAAGQSVAPEAEIRLRFSEAMDAAVFERSLRIEPAAVTTSTWSPELVEVVLTPERPLTRNTIYTLRLENSLRSLDGRSLAEPVELVFVVGDDAPVPLVEELYLALDEPSVGYPVLGATLEGMSYGDVVAVRWNAPMEAGPTEAATRMEPNVPLEFLWPDTNLMLIRPRARLEPGAQYRLRLAATARSVAGLQPAAPYEQAFHTAPDLQVVTEWSSSYGAVLSQDELVPGLILSHEVLEHHDEFSVSLLFAAPFRDEAEREHLLNSVRFVSLLPSSAPRPVLYSVDWSDERRVSLGYRNLGAGTEAAPYRYLWSLSRGWGGSRYSTDELRVMLELYR
ncbi:MAG: hypothetical protein EA428_11295 [Spirochaetaceae bacterium]|nr:MAG: hypothetical protein EA428_11295 [Spirochaetaceae bacterium]